jgi:multiple sugar transport system permease protein
MATAVHPRTGLTAQSRRRRLIENIEAYLFLSPAALLIFIFGLFPVAFAFYVSLHRWRRFPGDYQGLANYTRALGDFAYVVFFWIALGALLYGLWLIYRQLRTQPRGLLALLPGALITAATLLFVQWFVTLLPLVLTIPQRIRGQERVPGLFMQELITSLQAPEVLAAHGWMWAGVIAALVGALLWRWLYRRDDAANALVRAASALICLTCAVLTFQLTASAVETAVMTAQADARSVDIWAQVIIISLGVMLLGAAWVLWQRAQRIDGDRRFIAQAAFALTVAAAGYILITQIPAALSASDPDLLSGFGVTIMFVLGTVPLQLAVGLALAYLLFQNIKGKSLFRVAYFMPYIMPFVATSIVFNILFSHRPASPINQLMTTLGLPLQKWLLEPKGIFELMFGTSIPDWLAGPSLALVVIILYTVWTYIGYCTVVFLAGLGNISTELYEAARIDGANGWDIFRKITLPLLSPTTFFLSLIAIIGTFQAFTQIWIMRTPAAANSVDTVGVVIFETVRSTDPNMGYASALSLVLFIVILILTLIQNRYAGRNVFYG